jgi:hypothetical protein
MEENIKKTIGMRVGIVAKTCKVTNEEGDAVTITVNVDFSTATDTDIKNWLTADRIIAGQRPWRKLSRDEIIDMNGQTFNAASIGMKVRSKAEQRQDMINVFVASGVPIEQATALAEAAINNPASLKIVNETPEPEPEPNTPTE